MRHDIAYRENFIGEKFVSHIWDGGHFAKNALRAKDGRKIEVIYRGQLNSDSGADFHNAEIKIGDQVLKGDVEIHVKSSQWRIHHHDVNPRYNNTILHVVMWDNSISLLVRKQDGERIPTLVLYDYLDNSIGKLWKKLEEGEEEPSPCRRKAETLAPETIGAVLDRSGMDRFLHKTREFEQRLEENNADQLLYEGIMEALGYSKNREQFRELAQKVPLEILIGQPPERIQAVLFNVAGLFPSKTNNGRIFDEDTEEYISKLEMLWIPFSSRFKSQQMSGERWEFFRLRPGNFPTIRIAGISYVLSKCGNGDGGSSASLLEMFLPAFIGSDSAGRSPKESKTSRELRDMLMLRTSGYWTRHYTFGGRQHKEKPFLIGRSRADDIIINIVLPVAFAFARRLQDDKLNQAVVEVYTKHKKLQSNKIGRYVAGQIFRDRKEGSSVVNSAMRQQGLIHLYRVFCAVRNCQSCPLTEENIENI